MLSSATNSKAGLAGTVGAPGPDEGSWVAADHDVAVRHPGEQVDAAEGGHREEVLDARRVGVRARAAQDAAARVAGRVREAERLGQVNPGRERGRAGDRARSPDHPDGDP